MPSFAGNCLLCNCQSKEQMPASVQPDFASTNVWSEKQRGVGCRPEPRSAASKVYLPAQTL